MVIFFKASKLQLVNERSFIIHKRAPWYLASLGFEEEIVSELQTFMKDESTYAGGLLQPPGCVMVSLQIKGTEKVACVATVHISWKHFRYPILQTLQVRGELLSAIVCPWLGILGFSPQCPRVVCLCGAIDGRLSHFLRC